MSKPVKILIKYGAAILICAVVAVAFLAERDFLSADLRNQYRLLSDACSVPGLLCLFFGLSIWLSNEGAFDGVTWVVTYAVKSIIPGGRRQRETYGDYVVRRRGKKTSGFGFLIVIGLAMVAASLVFLYLFNSVA